MENTSGNTTKIIDILNAWAEYSKYDTEQKSFNLLSNSYTLHNAGKIAEKVINDYDTSGVIAILMLKEVFTSVLEDTRISLHKAITDESIEETRNMYSLFNSEIVREAEELVCNTLRELYREILGMELITDKEKEHNFNFTQYLGDVIKDIEKLNIDVYKMGSEPLVVEKFNKSLAVFNTLGEAVLDIERNNDGVYMCYININSSADSYFCIFVKSKGTLIGLNDRINEKYPGQHQVQSRRNGRWAENKRVSLFPYDSLLSYSDYCSKGCATRFKIDSNINLSEDETKHIPFKLLNEYNGYNALLLGLILIKMKYNNKIVENTEITYVESLVDKNEKIISKCYDVSVIGKSDVALKHRTLNLDITSENVINNDLGIEGFYNNELVTLFGNGFTLDTEDMYNSTNIELLLKGDVEEEVEVRPEYIGSEDRLKRGYFYIGRKQLAEHIKSNMKQELKTLGGVEEIDNWYKTLLRKNMHNIIGMGIKEYTEVMQGKEKVLYGWSRIGEDKMDIFISENTNYAEGCAIKMSDYLNKREDGKFVCPITECACNVFFVFRPKTAKGISELTGLETESLPNIVRVWKRDWENNGNSILNMIDPVNRIEHIFKDNDREYKYTFEFAIGISRRALKKILNMRK